VAPCLAAGSVCILKPSEMASLTCQALGDICHAAGLPKGCLNVLTGLGSDAGAPLVAHRGVDKVAFTGSLATGRRIGASCAADVTPVTLELGGKSPILVFDDASLASDEALDNACEWICFGIFWTVGQICSATSRLLLQASLAPRLLPRLKQHAERIAVSDPLAPGCRLGPIVSEAQYAKVSGFIDRAVAEGASLLTGGKRPPGLNKGYYLQPTILTGVTPDMELFREEVFGPVLGVTLFETEEEAVALANGSDYALGAAVLSSDEARLQRLAECLECGILWQNCSQPCFCHAPWGGRKRSGFGRELGDEALGNYTNTKQVTRYTSGEAFGWFPRGE